MPSSLKSPSTDTTERPSPLFLGGFLVAAGITIYKAVNLSMAMSSSWHKQLLAIGRCDLAFLGVIGLLITIAAAAKRKFVQTVTLLLIVAANIVHLADTYVVVMLNQRLTFHYVAKFVPEYKLVLGFITPSIIACMVVCLLCHGIHWRLPRRQLMVTFGFAVVVTVFGVYCRAIASDRFVAYMFPPAPAPDIEGIAANDNEADIEPDSATTPVPGLASDSASETDAPADKKRVAYFSAAQMAASRERYKFAGTMDGETRNIVFIAVENLSAVDSKKASGIHDWLPRLDTIAADGMMFRNFFGNYGLSEGGIVALFASVPPIPFPYSTRSLHSSFSHQDSPVRHLRAKGYRAEVVLSASRTFQRWDSLFEGIGFQRIIGCEDEVYKGTVRHLNDWIDDGDLYAVTLDRYDVLAAADEPFLLLADTSSSHGPWIDPLERENTEENVWDYTDRCLLDLYNALRERRFFDDGVLIICGDHRKGIAPSDAEYELYGDSADWRSLLVVIGKDIPAGVIDDRFIQQSDLLPKLHLLPDLKAVLSPNPIGVEIFTRAIHQYDAMGRLQIFDEKEGGRTKFSAYVFGSQFAWQGEKPAAAAEIERMIQQQRAVHQYNLRLSTSGSKWTLDPAFDVVDTSRNGVLYRTFDCQEMAHGLSETPVAYERVSIVDTVGADDILAAGHPLNVKSILEFVAFLNVTESGVHWFRTFPDFGVAMSVDKTFLIHDRRTLGWDDSNLYLEPGRHRIDLRFADVHHFLSQGYKVRIEWKPPSSEEYILLAHTDFFLPLLPDATTSDE